MKSQKQFGEAVGPLDNKRAKELLKDERETALIFLHQSSLQMLDSYP